MQNRKFVFRWFPVFLWMAVIYLVSSSSNPFVVVPEEVTLPDETIGRISHVIEYAILAGLVLRAMLLERKMVVSKGVWRWSFAITFAYSIFDELHQSLVPERSFQFLDLGLDMLGLILGLLSGYLIVGRQDR